jgi:hypothetical protein
MTDDGLASPHRATSTTSCVSSQRPSVQSRKNKPILEALREVVQRASEEGESSETSDPPLASALCGGNAFTRTGTTLLPLPASEIPLFSSCICNAELINTPIHGSDPTTKASTLGRIFTSHVTSDDDAQHPLGGAICIRSDPGVGRARPYFIHLYPFKDKSGWSFPVRWVD